MEEDIGERLREAACVGDLTLVSKLQSQGVDLNSKNSLNGWTALHWACKRNHEKVVSYLLEKGADKSVANKDGHIPAQLTSNENIRQSLGAPPDAEVKITTLPITPNYLANPPFPYAAKNGEEQSYSDYLNQSVTQKSFASSSGDARYMPYPQGVDSVEVVLKARLANCDEKDFIEIELNRATLDYVSLLNLMCAELNVDKNLVAKIRKLPDTIVRKDKDVKRLRDFQELEIVLTNKAMSAASRTYSIAPAKNTETILY
ncbi:ankyrin repeat domain-containing protein 40 [Aplysia californica]|uniref:Ankyrin repeat domain-containing protein 40 n=1 Tax=Aplysia californica TaxID=6500 RepID=A0ABM0JFG0_APLCA|nr:ankyrin repeat domain-containing protein 40 [Aplysia californica]